MTQYRYILFLILCMGSLLSCEKELNYLYQVKMDADFIIPSGLNTLETFYFRIDNVPTFYKENAALHQVDTASISDVKASFGLLKPVFNDVDLNFIESVVVNVYVDNINAKKEMYYLEFAPLNTKKELKLLSSTTALENILKNELVTVEVGIKLRQYSIGPIKAKLDFGYVVF